MITVISTGFNAPTKKACRKSVSMQSTAAERHIYIEASEQSPPQSACTNFLTAASAVPDDHIIVMLDGDDRLAHTGVLARIAREYEDPDVWMTYGSFVFADGRPGTASQVVGPPRAAPFTATHLKTFRAALFHHAAIEHSTLAWDLAVMFPLLELAGDHARFIPEVLYVYNLASSFEFNTDQAGRNAERAAAEAIRARSAFATLESL